MPDGKIRVLVVDDHALFRRALAGLLEKEGGFEIVGQAADGGEAVAEAQRLHPDLVVMDVHMPGTDGLQATRQIAATVPATRIVMLTISEDDRDLFEAIKGGAHGYLLKTVEPEALYAMLRGVLRGEPSLSPATAAKILREVTSREPRRSEAALGSDLTARERSVLELLVAGLTNKEIAGRLEIAENTVKNHLKAILGKLHSENRVQAATIAIRRGLVREAPPTT